MQVIRREVTLDLPFFDDASQAPLPPEEVRIESLEVQPFGDGRRLKVQVHLTPFQIPPSIDLVINKQDLEEVASTSIIGAGSPRMALVMHLRLQDASGRYSLVASASYEEHGEVDRKQVDFTLPDDEGSLMSPGADD